MYKGKDRKTIPLFSELFPFGGKLDTENRWLKISSLIPWYRLESKYQSYFSDIGRPAKDGRLVIGILLLKHMSGLSDDEIVKQVSENPYMQAFCGLENFVTVSLLNSSSLSKIRKRLGKKYFSELERETYHVLIEQKIIKGRGMLVDATVFPEYVRYPTDSNLLNEAREWVVKRIKTLGSSLGIKVRTYCRKAHKEFLNFSKKKTRSKKAVRRIKKSLLQYLRRNINQMESLLEKARDQGIKIEQKVLDRLDVVRTVYKQQLQMYRQKINRINDRIVSLHRPWTRPIVRGKLGNKKVEFGPKAAISYVDGFAFLEHLSSDNFSEATRVKNQIEQFERFFGKKPKYIVGDKLYGNRENRKLVKEHDIRDAFEPLGRRNRNQDSSKRWRKQKQRERNRIEGIFGHGKNHFSLDKIKYYIEDGTEIWVRLGLMAMNLKTAVKRI
ncbi:IS5 family transposase [bacterium]|jgi:transposase, IS5 family|nr:IS5 family transposase [bacterium]